MKPQQTIDIGGAQRPIRFGIGTLVRIEEQDKDKRSFQEIAESGRLSDIVTMLYFGMKSGAAKLNKKFEYDRETVLNWLDEMSMTEATAAIEKAMEAAMPEMDEEEQAELEEAGTEDPTQPGT